MSTPARRPTISPTGTEPTRYPATNQSTAAAIATLWAIGRPAPVGADQGSDGGRPDPELVQVAVEVGGVLVDAEGAGPVQLVAAVAAREQADAQGPRPLRRQHVPDAVPDHDGVGGVHPQAGGGGQGQG